MVALAQPSADDRIRAALWFADHGFRVFSVWSAVDGVCRCPNGAGCTSPGKHPITPHGFQDATQDPERIRVLLSAGSAPNYGLVCPDGVFAWDLDGDGWQQQIATLEGRFGALPSTLTTRTANGEHRFYRWPESFPRPIGKMFGWVTRWGSGRDAGYVIGPRSIHPSGREYAPGTVFDIAVLPDAWAESVLGTDTPLDSPTITIGGYRLPDPDFDGSRYDEIRNYMASRYMRGLEREEIWQGVVAVLAPRFRHPLPESDLRARFDRAWAKIAERLGAPLDAPETEDPDTGELVRRPRAADDEGLGILPARGIGDFPAPAASAAFDGLLGECVAAIAPGTDASTVGLLGSLLAFCGALVPAQARFHRIQTTSPFIALVGESSVGRKGTAMMRARDAVASAIEPMYVNRVILDGLNSGEGLVTTLHYKREAFPHEPTVGLVFEEEYAALLASRSREGSTLDPKMRAAFDGGPLSNRRSGETKQILPPYWLPALIAITPDELRRRLEAGALQSGSANRWLYLPVRKRDITPTNDDPTLPAKLRRDLTAARRWALDTMRTLAVEPAVTTALGEYDDFLPGVSHGASRDLTRRLGVIAFRVALVHAAVERSSTVTKGHLGRAMALTEYAREGIPWVFGEVVGSPDADLLLRNLLESGRLTKNAITRGIVRDPIRQQAAIDELVRLGRATVVTTRPERGGRPRTELVPTTQTGSFVHFVPKSIYPRGESREMLDEMDETPVSRSNGLDETWTKRGRNSDETGRNSDETPRDRHGWLRPCLDYARHMNAHRQTDSGWVCDACES